MQVPTLGRRLYFALMFVVVSALGGALIAGQFVPAAGIAAESAKMVAGAMQSLPEELQTPPQAEPSRVLMADGTELTNFYDENRVYVKLDKIALMMRQAQITIEDQRFYEHGALDLRGTLRALVRTTSGNTQGGSTLTQQYVKLVLLNDAVARDDKDALAAAQQRTVARKVLELRYAIALEQRLSKDDILERYLNISYFGDGAYGVEAAARHYFNTTAARLTLPQAAMLAGLVRNPATTDPVRHEKIAIERRNNVLDRMSEIKVITKAEAAKAKTVKFDRKAVQPHPHRGCNTARYPHLCSIVEKTLLKLDSLGKTHDERRNTLYRSGLTIQTQIDPRTQDAAQAAVSNYIVPTDPVIGVMTMIEPGTGLIKAMAQSRVVRGANAKAGESYINYGVPLELGGQEGYFGGSTFKAFTLTAAVDKGISPYRRIFAPRSMSFGGRFFRGCDGPLRAERGWTVSTGSEGDYSMYDGAKYSSNTFFVQLERETGLCDVVKMAERLGLKRADGANLITGKLPDGTMSQEGSSVVPAFTLGTAYISPLSLAQAYSTLAARGKRCEPIIIKSVTTKDNKQLRVPDGDCEQVISPEVADRVNDILHGAFQPGGTASSANIPGYDLAGKTGTDTNAPTIWTMGYTPNLVGAAMISVDRTHKRFVGRRKTLEGVRIEKRRLAGSSGREAGAGIWKPAMRKALSYMPKSRFPRPGRVTVPVRTDPQVAIPSCVGMSLVECRDRVEMAGFNTRVVRRYSDSPAGAFLGSWPRGQAPAGTMINLRVSRGPRPRPVPVRTTTPPAPPRTVPAPATRPAVQGQPTVKPKPKPTTKPATKPTAPPTKTNG